jgi:hypothetical protein
MMADEWVTFDCDLPPSLNRFMGHLGNKSPIVQQWIVQANKHYLMQKRGLRPVLGQYEMEITFRENKGDLSNRVKVVEDFVQNIGLVENDRLCRRLLVQFGDPPHGCRVRIRKT